MNSSAYFLGFFVGILVVGVVAVVCKKLLYRGKCELDERQVLARGKAFQISFFVLLIWNAGSYTASDIVSSNSDLIGFITLLGIIVSVSVFAIISIINDAYLGINRKASRMLLMFGIIGCINIFCGLVNIFNGSIIDEAGDIRINLLYNLAVGIMLILICIVLAVKVYYIDKREQVD